MKQNGKAAYTPEFVESLKDGQVFGGAARTVLCHPCGYQRGSC